MDGQFEISRCMHVLIGAVVDENRGINVWKNENEMEFESKITPSVICIITVLLLFFLSWFHPYICLIIKITKQNYHANPIENAIHAKTIVQITISTLH